MKPRHRSPSLVAIWTLIANSLAWSLVAGGTRAWGQAGDLTWPQFRGPLSNPVGDHLQLPTRWSLTDDVEWSVEIPGRGWSSPIVVGQRVFLTSVLAAGESKPAEVGTNYSNQYMSELAAQGLSQAEILKKLEERDFEMPDDLALTYVLICLDLETGAIHWQTTYHSGKPPGGRHRKNSFCSETPVADNERVYVHVPNLGVFAFDFAGKLVWRQDLPNRPIYLNFGTGGSPLLVDDRLIVLNDNEEASYLAAFRTSDGAPLWEVARGDFAVGERPLQASGWTTPYLWKNSQRTEIITLGPGRLVSYDPDGQELWRLTGVRPGPAASPFAVDDQLIINGGAPQPMYVIRPGAAGDISLEQGTTSNDFVVWSKLRATSYIPTPLVYQGGLYVLNDNGILTRLDLATGEESYKQRVKSSGADFTTSPWAYNGKVFLASEQGDVFVVPAGEDFEVEATIRVGEMFMATPALTPQRLLLRTEKRIMAIRKI
jgi:outer membrane protein assembly factor BamB